MKMTKQQIIDALKDSDEGEVAFAILSAIEENWLRSPKLLAQLIRAATASLVAQIVADD
jgi:hypothetical protein